ncbi:hypothetical protein SISNIDRAFT_467732 [Sistotremastrum niveocremeum HHB9708]|uniref:Uncharacterized protein n=1 Tax=Sistotremastrum niveocremeum HHB9708 TaxID=1314777 RepID=A0A164SHK9_9AGAM|nr:hypothetical protein SISNIDRAFT_467732 [Sistotremastrum niveocremeum HHB9708]
MPGMSIAVNLRVPAVQPEPQLVRPTSRERRTKPLSKACIRTHTTVDYQFEPEITLLESLHDDQAPPDQCTRDCEALGVPVLSEITAELIRMPARQITWTTKIERHAPGNNHAISSETPPSVHTEFALSWAAPPMVPPGHPIHAPKALIPPNVDPFVQNLCFDLPDPIIQHPDRASSILSDRDASHVASNIQRNEEQPRKVENVQDVAREQANVSSTAETITFVTRDIGPRLSIPSECPSPALVSNTVYKFGELTYTTFDMRISPA